MVLIDGVLSPFKLEDWRDRVRTAEDSRIRAVTAREVAETACRVAENARQAADVARDTAIRDRVAAEAAHNTTKVALAELNRRVRAVIQNA